MSPVEHPHIVAIGGGSGPSLLARAFADQLANFTAVICTSDRGSSTGVCRRAFGIPAPGDVRATLSAFASLSGRQDWAELWETRLNCPEMEPYHGMALGNLILSGLMQRTNNMTEAIRTAGDLLGIQGTVLPATEEPVDLEVELEDGTVIQKESEVRRTDKPPIKRLGWVGPPPGAPQGVLDALRGADFMLIGPGCLYTSVLSCLLVEGVSEAVKGAGAYRVYICNTTTTPGQTDGLSVARHVEVVWKALGEGGLDAAVINVERPTSEKLAAYERLGVSLLFPTEGDFEIIEAMGVRALTAPVLERPRSHPRTQHKVDTIRHDPAKLRSALDKLVDSR